MSVDTANHATFIGYCAGTLLHEIVSDSGRCLVCGHDAGITHDHRVGHHVQEPGPRPVIVDEDDSLTTVMALNTPVPGLIIATLPDHLAPARGAYQIYHAPSGLIIHSPRYFWDAESATAVAMQLGQLTDWLGPIQQLKDDPHLGHAVAMATFMACGGSEQ